MAVAAPDRLHYTDSDEANELIATDPLALLIGFALDQQVVLHADGLPRPAEDQAAARDARDREPRPGESWKRPSARPRPCTGSPARWRRASRISARSSTRSTAATRRGSEREASGADDLRKRIAALPGSGEMKIKALSAVLWKRFGVPGGRGPRRRPHPTLGDVDSREALDAYQEKKRAYKAKLRAEKS